MLKKILIGLLILLAGAAIFFLVTFNQMSSDVEKYAPIKKGKEDRIVLFNAGNGDRQYISQLIDAIQKCNPRVLALDLYFRELKDPESDSILMSSLNANNVVLASRYDGEKTYAVHENFLKQVTAYGYAESIQRGRFTIDAFYVSKKGSNHFAYEIANKYDRQAANRYKKRHLGQQVDMVFTRLDHQFKLYEFQELEFDCDLIMDKIALIGYFGKDDDLHVTRSRYHEKSRIYKDIENEPDMHGPTAVANQILMILDQEEMSNR